jgi:hypothetical protein
VVPEYGASSLYWVTIVMRRPSTDKKEEHPHMKKIVNSERIIFALTVYT